MRKFPILIGKSGASVVRIQSDEGLEWIEKSGSPEELSVEAAVTEWCLDRLPVPKVLAKGAGLLMMSVLPGVDLAQVSRQCAVAVIAEALKLIHSTEAASCPFSADWKAELQKAEHRVHAGLVDTGDFEISNRGRSARDILAELQSFPPIPDLICFTHGDACLPNFLCMNEKLTGIVDLGRAGIAHPARDWALAFRSMRTNFGAAGEQSLRDHVPAHCVDPHLLRRFRLLDELF